MKRSIKTLIALYSFIVINLKAQTTAYSHFDLFRNGSIISLTWNIDNSSTCEGINIMRSIGGDTLNFEIIGYIPGMCGENQSSKSYKYNDEQPTINQTNNYKIRIGYREYSEIKSLYFEGEMSKNIVLEPNPAVNSCTIYFKNDAGKRCSIEIINNKSQSVWTKEDITDNQTTIQTNTLESGIYIVVIKTADDLLHQKLIVSH